MIRPAFVCFLAIGTDRFIGNTFEVLAKHSKGVGFQRRQTLLPDHQRRIEE
jgi:hypothetical protein